MEMKKLNLAAVFAASLIFLALRPGSRAGSMGRIDAGAARFDRHSERQKLGHCARQGVFLGAAGRGATEWPARAAISAQGPTAGSETP